MKNITLSAREEVIEAARKAAAQRGTTLNAEFRVWIETQQVSREDRTKQYEQVMKRLSHFNAGRKFTREEMNER